jgi:hypothetical protein
LFCFWRWGLTIFAQADPEHLRSRDPPVWCFWVLGLHVPSCLAFLIYMVSISIKFLNTYLAFGFWSVSFQIIPCAIIHMQTSSLYSFLKFPWFLSFLFSLPFSHTARLSRKVVSLIFVIELTLDVFFLSHIAFLILIDYCLKSPRN